MATVSTNLQTLVKDYPVVATRLLERLDAFNPVLRVNAFNPLQLSPSPLALLSLAALQAKSRENPPLSWRAFTKMDLGYKQLSQAQLSKLTEEYRNDYELYIKTRETEIANRMHLRSKKIAYVFFTNQKASFRGLYSLLSPSNLSAPLDCWLFEASTEPQVKYLLQLSCNPNIEDPDGNTPTWKTHLRAVTLF